MRRGLSLLASLAFLSLSVTPLSPVSAASTEAATSVPSITLTEQPFLITSTTRGRFVFQLPAGVRALDARIEIQIRRRVASRSSFLSIANEDVESAIIDSFSQPLSQLTRSSTGNYSLTIPFTSRTNTPNSLTVPFEGVYPVSVVLTQEDNVLAKVLTFVHRRDPDSTTPQVPVSVAVRLAPLSSLQPDGSVALNDKVRDEIRQFISFVSATNSPLTVSIQPEVVSALAASLDPQDAALLTQLHALLRTRTITTSSFASLDPSLFAAINRGQEFIEQVRFGEATLNRLLPGVPLQRGTWWATHPLSTAGVNLLRTAGIVSIVLSPAAQRGVSAEAPLGVLARPDGNDSAFMSVVSIDAGVAKTLASGGGIVAAYRAVSELIMERDDLLAKGHSASSIRLMMSTSTGALDADGVLERAERQLAGFSQIDLGAPQTIAAGAPVIDFPAVTKHGGESRQAGIAVARSEYAATVSMTNESDPRRVLWQSLLSLGESSAVADPNQYIAGLRAQLSDVRGSVTVTTPRAITLSGRQGAIRIQLRNDSSQPLAVKVRMSSAKLNLDRPVRIVTLAAGSTTEMEVLGGIKSNGRFPISVRVTTPVGNLEVVPYITITAKVNAIAGLGQLVSISLLLIILAWWWSHWRRSRLRAESPTTVSSQ